MEPKDDTERDEHKAGDSPPGREPAAREGGPQVIDTEDPMIATGAAHHPGRDDDPDRTSSIETSRIRGANAMPASNFVVVPVAENRATHPDDRREDKGGKGEPRDEGHHKGKPATAPSLTKILIYAGVVALVCGIVGAAGYSYFFGPSKKDDSQSSGKDSDSGSSKGSDSGDDSGSSKGSNSGKGSDPSRGPSSSSRDSDGGGGKFAQAQSAWLTAVKELHQARSAEKAARRSEEETKAVLDFLNNTLLSAGRPGDGSLADAFWSGGQGKDLSLRKAVDMAESQVAGAFTERPLAEASVRAMLGHAYLSLGDPSRAVEQLERAYVLRQATEGPGSPETADCRNQLAVAYRLAGRAADGGRLFDQNPSAPGHAAALAVRGKMLLLQNQPAEAELKLRECLTLREKARPDDWTTSDTKSILGEALLDQKKYAEAEPLLLEGYEGLKQHKDEIPEQDRTRVSSALGRLVKLYEAWGKMDKVLKWRQELKASDDPKSPGSSIHTAADGNPGTRDGAPPSAKR